MTCCRELRAAQVHNRQDHRISPLTQVPCVNSSATFVEVTAGQVTEQSLNQSPTLFIQP